MSTFVSTLREVKRMIGTWDPLKPKPRKEFVPVSILRGMREKNRQRRAREQERARTENIQYDSSMKFFNNPSPSAPLTREPAAGVRRRAQGQGRR